MIGELVLEVPSRMGQYLKNYEPKSNVNTFINSWTTKPTFAFTPEPPKKKIPDYSFWQGDIEFAKMRAQTNASITRAGQNSWVDKKWERNWTIAKSMAMFRGAYWFYDDRLDPGRQADIFIALLKADPPEMEVWCDWEYKFGGAFGDLSQVVAFMEKVEKAGFKIGMYTGYYFFVENSNSIKHYNQYKWLKTRPLWLAWYTNDFSEVRIPAPWSELLLWQFGTPAVGLIYGCESLELDMNIFVNLTEEQFNMVYGVATTPDPTETNKVIDSQITIFGKKYRANKVEEIINE